MVEELKPYIDAHFRTLPDVSNTFIMGSSMGGLISLYALCEYPQVFFGAGCVSTHFPIGRGITLKYLQDHLPDPETHKFYFDYGTKTLDRTYETYQNKADKILKDNGFIMRIGSPENLKVTFTAKRIGENECIFRWNSC
jgi:predicted alpha/beta superfamily hydrolase